MKWIEIIDIYGLELANLMKKSSYLQGITVTISDGEFDIPERDIKLAYRDVIGAEISPLEWD